jgi:hypothetical protein
MSDFKAILVLARRGSVAYGLEDGLQKRFLPYQVKGEARVRVPLPTLGNVIDDILGLSPQDTVMRRVPVTSTIEPKGSDNHYHLVDACTTIQDADEKIKNYGLHYYDKFVITPFLDTPLPESMSDVQYSSPENIYLRGCVWIDHVLSQSPDKRKLSANVLFYADDYDFALQQQWVSERKELYRIIKQSTEFRSDIPKIRKILELD